MSKTLQSSENKSNMKSKGRAGPLKISGSLHRISKPSNDSSQLKELKVMEKKILNGAPIGKPEEPKKELKEDHNIIATVKKEIKH